MSRPKPTRKLHASTRLALDPGPKVCNLIYFEGSRFPEAVGLFTNTSLDWLANRPIRRPTRNVRYYRICVMDVMLSALNHPDSGCCTMREGGTNRRHYSSRARRLFHISMARFYDALNRRRMAQMEHVHDTTIDTI